MHGLKLSQWCLFAVVFVFFLRPTENFWNYNGNCIVELFNITYMLSDV